MTADAAEIVRLAERITDLLPKHAASLTISHNDHLGYYSTVAREIEDDGHGMDAWVSEEEKQRSIDTNEVWLMQWYPDTPVGFYTLAASSLGALLVGAASALSDGEG